MIPTLTVFTPTYNRANCLHKCYDSLVRQSCRDFLWIIIDDGSTDNTRKIVENWKRNDNGFEIQYYYKNNGGLHTGYNEAIKHSKTELMVCIDSDDYMPDNAIEIIISFWKKNGSNKYAGIVGLDVFENGQVVGDKFPDIREINLIDLLTNKYKIKNGDRKLVVRTELYKKYAPMPSFNGEKNFNPHYMNLQISTEYDFLVLNKPLCIIEYQEDGMSNSIFQQYLNSPLSFAQTRRLYMVLPKVNKLFVCRQCIHYVSSCILSKNYKDIITKTPRKFMTVIAIPFGIVLSMFIKIKKNK